MRAYIIDFGRSWDSYVFLAEFSYNNNYHSSIGAPPLELIYDMRFRTPVSWGEVGHRVMGSSKEVLHMIELIQ